MGTRAHSRVGGVRLLVEYLEDRTNPSSMSMLETGLPASQPTSLDGSLGDSGLSLSPSVNNRVNVVTSGATAADLTAPFTSEVRSVGFGIFNVTLTSGTSVDDAVSYYSTLPGVTAAEPDYVIQTQQVPNDPSYSSLWGMAKIGAPTAWDTTTGSSDFVVAVIDTGVDYNHPDLAANIWHNPAEVPGDGIDNDGNGIVDDYYGANFVGAVNSGNPMDDNGHGTHVSGTIGAIGNNGVGVVGVNWNVKIMALKFLDANGSGSTSDAIEALNYAVAHGVKVSNNSWGGGGYSSALFNAIQAAQNAGHIFVAAAGNSNVNIDSTPSYPASYNLANVVAVASTTSTDARSSFSNYGANTVDIAAPGSSILSTTPNNTYSTFSGTSMATPHVTGAIALYWSQYPNLTAQEVISKLKSSADVISGLAGVTQSGRLNVAKMFENVPPPPPPPPADTAGPRVTAATYSGTAPTNLNKVRFTFNEAINPNSFTTADIVSLTGPAGSISASSVTPVSGSNNTQFDIAFPTQTATGTYTIVIGPDITDLANNPMDQNNNGTNGENPADRYTASQTLNGIVTKTFTAGGLPITIADVQTTSATITVNEDITISDINVKFTASHTWDSDLIIKLIGPGGQSSTLVNRRGGSGDNFNGTTFDDEASTAISRGKAPFAGTFRPETTLSVFDTRNVRGVWTLQIQDVAAGDTGTLTAFSITVTGTGGNGQQKMSVLGFRDVEPIGTTPPASTTVSTITTAPVAAVPIEIPASVPTVVASTPAVPATWAIPVDTSTIAWLAPTATTVVMDEPEDGPAALATWALLPPDATHAALATDPWEFARADTATEAPTTDNGADEWAAEGIAIGE